MIDYCHEISDNREDIKKDIWYKKNNIEDKKNCFEDI